MEHSVMKIELTKEEKDKLEQAKPLFNVDNLLQEQIELIFGRKIVIRPAAKNGHQAHSIKRLFKPPHQKATNFDTNKLYNIAPLRVPRRHVDFSCKNKITPIE